MYDKIVWGMWPNQGLQLFVKKYAALRLGLQYKRAVFPPERAIAGIPCYNQRWPPEIWKKGQFGPFLLQDCRLNTGIIF